MNKFDRLNKETREYNSRNVDRFNESTRGNYNYLNHYRENNKTYYNNNGQHSNYYNYNR